MTKTTVSAVIPAYNAERFIRKAIDSVLAQTVPVAEVIVVDDGSRDSTCSVVESYGSPVRLLRQKNAGPSTARNLGARTSTSAYIGFLDADDAWHPEKLEKQLAAFSANPQAVLCYTGVQTFDDETGEGGQSPATPLDCLRAQLRIRNPQVVPSSVLVRREAFERSSGFDPGLKGSEDWDFAIAMLEIGPFCVAEDFLLFYRVSTTSLSSNADRMYGEALKMLDRRLLADMKGPRRWLWRHRVLSYQAYTAAMTSRAAGETARERHYILRSLLHWPLPTWHPLRFKAAAVTVRNMLGSQQTREAPASH